MPRNSWRYYVGRFNFLSGRHYGDKGKFLFEAISSSRSIERRGYKWGFFNVASEESKIGDLIIGYLAKYAPESEVEVARPEKHSIDDQDVLNQILAKSHFFLHSNTGLLAFHPAPSQIRPASFRKIFALLFEKALGNFFIDAEVSMVQDDRHELLQVLQKFSRLLVVKVELHPSNPNSRELWRGIDKQLREYRATNYREEIRTDAPDDSLRLNPESEIVRKIYMAKDGYGKASARGVLEGKIKTVSTSDNPMFIEVPKFEQLDHSVLDKVIGVFSSIIDRIAE